jgi:hypothetical protein
MDKFKYQPFETSNSSFLEPLSILWKKYSVNFPPEQVEALIQDIEEDYTTIFRLNDRTFNFIRESGIKLKMSDVQLRCAGLEGSDGFRAHVYREVLCRIIQAGAEKAPGPTGSDVVFDALSKWGKYATAARTLFVEVDAKTNLLGMKAHIRTRKDGKVYAYILLSENSYFILSFGPRNYRARIKNGLPKSLLDFSFKELENIIV